uniref:ATPase AAA-type core domain-containing protein n=1 Tax=Brassica campestris TaxID=3711 RepID=M4FDU9_BRACM
MVKKWWKTVVDVFHVYQSYKVPEFNNNLQENHLYMKVYAYLNSLSSMRIQISPTSSREKNQTRSSSAYIRTRSLETSFLQCRAGFLVQEFVGTTKRTKTEQGVSFSRFEKPINGEFSVLICSIYTRVTEELEQRNTELKLFMNVDDDMKRKKNGRTRWRSIPFNHPSTFDNIAMGTDLKSKVKSDLESFLKGKQYYSRLGRVWKQSYLLYGPPGTGKSSFVAAMAKFLDYKFADSCVEASHQCSAD